MALSRTPKKSPTTPSTRCLFSIVAVVVVLTHLHIHTLLHAPSQVQVLASPPPLLLPTPPPPPPKPPPPPSPTSLATTPPPSSRADALPAAGSLPRATDVAACEQAQSCLPCVRIKPRKPPNDSGVRCVWCGTSDACRGYIKGTHFPCADAIRGGGGYPGGKHCPKGYGASNNASVGRRAQAAVSAWARSARRRPEQSSASNGAAALLQAPPLSLAGDAVATSRAAPAIEESVEPVRTAPLQFSAPATDFREALPLGNGRLGASVYGGPWRDRIGVNEESIIGGPRVTADEVDVAMSKVAESAREMERLMAVGEVRAAEGKANTLSHGKVRSYEFLGAIRLQLAPSECAGADEAADDAVSGRLRCAPQPAARGYQRDLDLESAVATVSHGGGATGCAFSRQALVSGPDDVIALRLNGSCTFDAVISLDRADEKAALKVAATALDGENAGGALAEIATAGRALQLRGTSSGNGVGFAAVLALTSLAPGSATMRQDAGKLLVRGATEVTVLLTAFTDFDRRVAGEPPAAPEALVARCANTLEAAAAVGWAALRERHVQAHAARFRAFTLRLGRAAPRTPSGGMRSDLPTNERIRESRTATLEDYGLVEQAVQLGRYLLLASSSSRAQLPANLQGVWAEGARPPWGSDFHLNINLQQIYWPAGPLGLGETLAPLAPFLTRLAHSGAHVARHLYRANAKGAWMSHGFTDAWASAAPLAPPMWALCASCGGWAALQLWQRFEFSREATDLRSAWPLLRGSAAFFEGALLHRGQSSGGDDDGQRVLRWGPSHSPENAYSDGEGSSRYLSYDVALDLGVITHTVRALTAGAEALRALGELSSDDANLVARLQRLLPRLSGAGLPLVDADGSLAEWWGDGVGRPSADAGHRHFSHLYPLHPGDGIDPITQPALGQAARRALETRLRNGGGHTGWSAAWAVSLWARLHDGALAHAALRYTLHEFTSPALLGLHPVLKGKGTANGLPRCVTCVGRAGNAGDGIFQLDANGGLSAGVAEMLIQSHTPTCHVHLLPALPPAWPDGEATGLRARGALRIDVRWAGGRLASTHITRAVPTSPEATVVRASDHVSVCCAPRVCGSDDAALAAATKTTVRNASGVWAWQITLAGVDASWRMALA